MHPTTFYGSHRNELAFFVEDTSKTGHADSTDLIPVQHLSLIRPRHFNSRPRGEETIHGHEIRFADPLERRRIFDPEFGRTRPAQCSQVRAASNELAEIVGKAADVSSAGT